MLQVRPDLTWRDLQYLAMDTALPIEGDEANQQDTAQSDIDVLVVSASLGYGELFGALEVATTTLGRAVNPTLYSPDDLTRRRARDNAFVTRVLDQPKIWLIGDDETLNG